MSHQSDLFDSGYRQYQHLPNAQLDYWENWLPPAESQALFEQLMKSVAWEQSVIRLYGKSCLIPRLNAWYGDEGCFYTYSGQRMALHPWLPDLLQLRRQLEQQTGYRFNAVLVNCYRDGADSVAWHADDEPELGQNPAIASLSLGATRRFRLKHRFLNEQPVLDIDLEDGSLLLMHGETQHHWRHCLPKTKRTCSTRLNLTFRLIHREVFHS